MGWGGRVGVWGLQGRGVEGGGVGGWGGVCHSHKVWGLLRGRTVSGMDAVSSGSRLSFPQHQAPPELLLWGQCGGFKVSD